MGFALVRYWAVPPSIWSAPTLTRRPSTWTQPTSYGHRLQMSYAYMRNPARCCPGPAIFGASDSTLDVQNERAFIVIGSVLLVVGLAWPWLSRVGLRPPAGDIHVETHHGVSSSRS